MCFRLAREGGRETKTTRLMAKGVGRHEVQPERVSGVRHRLAFIRQMGVRGERISNLRGRKTKITKLIAYGIGSTWVQLERVNWLRQRPCLMCNSVFERNRVDSIHSKPKVAERITPTQEKFKGIAIKEEQLRRKENL
uniref:Uncharacterized protein n=1 Tax=Solanum tuberosum TaxID=4113 RepID=M1DUK1_SOLTU